MAYPTKPSGIYEIKSNDFASSDTSINEMSDPEFLGGYNNEGETATPLTKVPDAHKWNWHFSYINRNVRYAIEYVEELRTNFDAFVSGTVFIPTGTVVYNHIVPSTFLKLDGSLVSRTTYATLYSHAFTNSLIASEVTWASGSWGLFGEGDGSTTFRLPDLRGEFIRCNDEGKNIDIGRQVGTHQEDENKAHIHTFNNYPGGNNLLEAGSGYSWGVTGNTSSSGGTEARPRNISLVASIKY